jgi:hypothetical protein
MARSRRDDGCASARRPARYALWQPQGAEARRNAALPGRRGDGRTAISQPRPARAAKHGSGQGRRGQQERRHGVGRQDGQGSRHVQSAACRPLRREQGQRRRAQPEHQEPDGRLGVGAYAGRQPRLRHDVRQAGGRADRTADVRHADQQAPRRARQHGRQEPRQPADHDRQRVRAHPDDRDGHRRRRDLGLSPRGGPQAAA